MAPVIMENMLLVARGSSPDSYFGNGAVGVGNNDYDYDVWGPSSGVSCYLSTTVLTIRHKRIQQPLQMDLPTQDM